MSICLSSIRCAVILSVLISTISWGGEPVMVSVRLDDPFLHYSGIRYVDIQSDRVGFSRFDPDSLLLTKSELGFNPEKAINTTGGAIVFQTNSPTVRLSFRPAAGMNRGSEFGVFRDGQFIESQKFSPKQQEMDLVLKNEQDGKAVIWEVTLPSFSNPELFSLEIEKQSKLVALSDSQSGVYVAIGDSITHGTGQGSATHLTWPYILSRKLGFTLYNLAVGGSGVSVAAGQSLADFDTVDLVTILIGYNDWNGEGDSAAQFKGQYRNLIAAIRESHPETPVFCISPLFTRREFSKKSGLPIDGFREAVQQLETELSASDANLHFISGESVSSAANLNPDKPNDPVHLGINGAAMLAESIYPLVIE
jgi:lysophospholipase L1-like esterase